MKNLRSLRESRKLSQQKLADQFDLAQSQIQSYETGSYEPDILTLTAFADFFDTSIDYLVGRTDINRKIEPVKAHELSGAEEKLLEQYRRLLPNQKKSLSMFMETLTGEA
ncbi:MAG: helix-turn-helix domain-containing protein [Oscillospiraceae bacterium]|jgi:transcriptional regulator with XRE-family HTH domain|nr:helix-turn-helix domain-containing protein [Oscillospiraceae bacterium]